METRNFPLNTQKPHNENKITKSVGHQYAHRLLETLINKCVKMTSQSTNKICCYCRCQPMFDDIVPNWIFMRVPSEQQFLFCLLFYPSDYTLCVFLLFSVCFYVLFFIHIKQQRFLFLFTLSVCLLFNCVVFRLSLRWKIKQFNPTTVFFVPIFPVAVLGFSGEWNYDEHEK